MVRSSAKATVDQSRAAPMATIFLMRSFPEQTIGDRDYSARTDSENPTSLALFSRARGMRGCSAIGPTYIDSDATTGAVFALLANQRLPQAEYLLDNSRCYRD